MKYFQDTLYWTRLQKAMEYPQGFNGFKYRVGLFSQYMSGNPNLFIFSHFKVFLIFIVFMAHL